MIILGLCLVACGSPTPPLLTPGDATTATLTPAPAPTRTVTATPSATPSRTQTPASIPALRLPPIVTELARGFGEPDDLALMPDGTILFSDIGNGTIDQIAADGKVTTLLRGMDEPEGIVVLPDGALIVAEQKRKRLVRYQPGSGQPATTWLQLENRTGQAGVDNIAGDPATGDLIVPDSPNGRILRVSRDAKSVRVIASGLLHPTGAAVERDGSILVADEYGNTVQRLRTDGHLESLGRFSTPDDVAIDGADRIFVACLGDNSIRMIDPSNRENKLIATVRNPQGLVVDAQGNLVVAESSDNRVVRLRIR